METKYGFWGYDLYPFVVSAVITEEADEGVCKTAFGWVRPEVVLSGPEGLALMGSLRDLGEDYREHQKVVMRVFVEKVAALNPALTKVKSLSSKLTKGSK